MTISEAVENWINGNRSDVKAALQAMQPLDAAWFAVEVLQGLPSNDRFSFRSWLGAIT